MKLKYFKSTDTLYLELNASNICESKDLDENTVLDLDADANVCAITFELASARSGVQEVPLEVIAV